MLPHQFCKFIKRSSFQSREYAKAAGKMPPKKQVKEEKLLLGRPGNNLKSKSARFMRNSPSHDVMPIGCPVNVNWMPKGCPKDETFGGSVAQPSTFFILQETYCDVASEC